MIGDSDTSGFVTGTLELFLSVRRFPLLLALLRGWTLERPIVFIALEDPFSSLMEADVSLP